MSRQRIATRSHPPEVRARALELVAAGKSYREVAATIGVRVPTIYDWAMRPERWIGAAAPVGRKPAARKAGSGIIAPKPYHRSMRWGDRLE